MLGSWQLVQQLHTTEMRLPSTSVILRHLDLRTQLTTMEEDLIVAHLANYTLQNVDIHRLKLSTTGSTHPRPLS